MPAYTAMGDYAGPYDDELPEGVERKTPSPESKTDVNQTKSDSDTGLKVKTSGEANVLNPYRSVTYNFTLAGLQKGYLSDPKKYRESELDLVILKSGGKGTSALKVTNSFKAGDSAPGTVSQGGGRGGSDYAARDPRRLDLTPEEKNVPLRNVGDELMGGFNTQSPGRFDMFIDSIEIDSLMAFTQESGSTLPTQIKFEVIEPYSVNGFIEALHFAAVAAGYSSYIEASFVLKMEFWGYPDSDISQFTDPEIIPKSTRYFPIGLTGIEVDVTERGTRYRCSAVPHNERAFGEPNVIKKPIKMTGSTVGEILTDLVVKVNEQVAKSDEGGKTKDLANKHNIYLIKFPTFDEKEGWKDSPDNKIASSKLVEILKDNALYGMADPATTEKANAYKVDGKQQPTPDKQAKEPEAIKYTPGKTVVQFAENMNLHEAISSVIRDSEYVRNILKDVKKNMDEFGMIEYFMVKIEVENLDVMDETTKKPFQMFTYVVTPYKVHYTRIPTYGQEQIDDKKLTKLCNREYNYIYTGQNVDVVNFKLNFNTLFFEAIPAALGNKDTPSAKTGAAPSNGVDTKQTATPSDTVEKQQVPTAPVKVETTPIQTQGGQAGQPLTDSYGLIAKKMHNAIIDSKGSMLTGEIEILGDPFYLATGGVGNYNPKPDGAGKTVDGEADRTRGEILIRINFRNPIDINPETGMMDFDAKLVPFSGVYRVTKAASAFKDGVFKQRLEIMRLPGQILDLNIQASDPNDRIITVPDNLDRVVPDTTRSMSPSQRLDSSTAMEQLDRGLPSPGLPGELSNFTAATGGLGGDSSTLLVQSPGRVFKNGALASASSVVGSPLPTDVSSNIRLNSSGLATANQTGLSTAALVAVAANVLTGNVPKQRAVGALAAAIVGGSLAQALNKPNKGSGIGEGATLALPKVSTDLTANNIKFGGNIDPTKIASDTVNNVVGTTKELGTSALGIVNSLGKDVSSFVKGVGDKISSLTGTPADPTALGAKVGLDVSKLSGLGMKFQSKSLDQIASFNSNTPEGVNLNQAANNGVVLDYLPPSKIKNLPPTPSYSVAPPVGVDQAYLQSVAAKGPQALADLYGVSSVKELSGNSIPPDILSSALSKVPSYQSTPLTSLTSQFNSVDISSMKDKLGTVQSQLSSVTGKLPVPDQNMLGSVTAKFGSVSQGQSPLDKLVNKFNSGI
jgi:hypothetical protein